MGELTELELAERWYLAPSVVRHMAELGILPDDAKPVQLSRAVRA